MAQTTETPLDFITTALRLLTVIDEITPPTAEQATDSLIVLNDMMANYYIDGLRLGWFPQSLSTYTTTPAPIQDYDTRDVKLLLALELATHFGVPPSEDLIGKADGAFKNLCKRYIQYFNSDLTGLPFSQGGLFGPGRV